MTWFFDWIVWSRYSSPMDFYKYEICFVVLHNFVSQKAVIIFFLSQKHKENLPKAESISFQLFHYWKDYLLLFLNDDSKLKFYIQVV